MSGVGGFGDGDLGAELVVSSITSIIAQCCREGERGRESVGEGRGGVGREMEERGEERRRRGKRSGGGTRETSSHSCAVEGRKTKKEGTTGMVAMRPEGRRAVTCGNVRQQEGEGEGARMRAVRERATFVGDFQALSPQP